MKRKIHSLALLLLLFSSSFNSNSQTLVAGDIAFIGYHEDATDQFTWIALKDIPAGEEIYFTEKGWNATGTTWFTTTEGHMRWISPAGGVSCGTIVHINETAGNTFTVTGGGTATIALNSWSQSGGDQVLAYQGGGGVEPAVPVFISGVHADYNSGDYNPGTTWNNGTFTNVTSASMQPTGLTNLVNCISLHPSPGPEYDCTHYDGTLTGTAAALRTLINNPSNWGLNQSNATINITASAFPIPSVICASPCTDPDVPTPTASASPVCPGTAVTLDWTGDALNDATNWHIYTSSCGVTQIAAIPGNSLIVNPLVTTTYYIRGEDGAGCVDESTGLCGTVTVTVQDITNPTITCPANQNETVDGTCNLTLPDYTGAAVAADNCGAVTVTQSPVAGTIVGIGTTNVTLTATDGASNTANCNFDVIVTDGTNPTITCPANQNETVDATCNLTLPDYTGSAVAADNCGAVTVTQSPVAGTIVGIGTTNVTLTATDGNSNTANCNFDVIVTDGTNPTITCPANQNETVDGTCNLSLPDYTGSAVAADNCGAVTITQSPVAGTVVGVGTTNVTLTATDGNSNTANCNFDVIVTDGTNPTITCPANQNETVDGTCNLTLPDYTGAAVAADNCGAVTVTQSPIAGTVVGIGTTNVTLTATDGNSNTANCNFDVIVTDGTNPTITCPADQNEPVNASCQFLLPDYTGLAVVADNCNPAPAVTQLPIAGTTITGATVVTLTVDDGNGNTASCNFNAVGIDVINPTITCPANQNESFDATCNFTLPDYTSLATVADNCNPAPAVTQSPIAGTVISATTTITLTADDGSGNTASCTFDVIPADNTNPTITCPANQTETPNASCQFTLPDYTALATASDNCNPSPTVTQSPIAGTLISANTTITLTANDGASNTASCTFDVILNDLTAPTAVCQNITVYLDGAGNATIVAADIDGGSTDNCTGLTFSASQTAFTCANIGPNNVTLTATDGNTNSANCIAVVTVLDTISPLIGCPGNQLEVASAICDFILPDYTGMTSAFENCGSVTITQSPIAGTVITANTTITLTIDDGNGNTGTCTFDVNLDVSGCTGTECTNAIAVSLNACGDSIAVTGSTVGGTPTSQGACITAEGNGGANWYTFTGDGGTWTASTVNLGTTYDTKLWVFDGDCAVLVCVTGNDDFVGLQSQVTFPTTLGVDYFVAVGGFDTSEGDYELSFWNVEGIAPVEDAPSLSDVLAECEVLSVVAPTATDNCTGAITGTPDVTFPISAQGTTLVTWTYDDGNGNTSTQTQNVIITDVTGPVADSTTLPNVTDECSVTSLTPPTATDNCGGSVTVTNDATLPITAQGTTTVTWTYADGVGNTSTQTQDVVITDATAPSADVATLSDINDECEVTPTAPTATDNCTGAITGTPDVTFPITASGTTTITWTYVDGNGNSSSQTQDVIITPIDDGITQVDIVTLSADATGYNYQWVDCDNGNTPVTGATSQTFTPAADGNYACVVDNGTCSVTTPCLSSSAAGIGENNVATLLVYPNPTDGMLSIDFEGEITNIEVVDMSGRMISVPVSVDNKTVDGTQLAPGNYMIRITTGANNLIVKEFTIRK